MSKSMHHCSQAGQGEDDALAVLTIAADGLVGTPKAASVTSDLLAQGKAANRTQGQEDQRAAGRCLPHPRPRRHRHIRMSADGTLTAGAPNNLWVGWRLPNGSVAIRDSNRSQVAP